MTNKEAIVVLKKMKRHEMECMEAYASGTYQNLEALTHAVEVLEKEG